MDISAFKLNSKLFLKFYNFSLSEQNQLAQVSLFAAEYDAPPPYPTPRRFAFPAPYSGLPVTPSSLLVLGLSGI